MYEDQSGRRTGGYYQEEYGSSAVMQSAAEIIAFGTAVKFVNK